MYKNFYINGKLSLCSAIWSEFIIKTVYSEFYISRFLIFSDKRSVLIEKLQWKQNYSTCVITKSNSFIARNAKKC